MTFDLQPTLVGEHVTVRPMREADREPLYAVANDPELWAGHPAKDRWQRPVFDALFEAGLASGGGMVFEDSAGRVIGSSRFYEVTADSAVIGYTFIGRDHWGDGTNAEVKRLMVDHAHRFVPRAQFHVGRANGRSRRAMEKVGGALVQDGTPEDPDRLVYEITRA